MPSDNFHMSCTAAICLPRKLSCSPLLVGHPCPVPHFCDLSCTLLLLTYPAPKWVLLGPSWRLILKALRRLSRLLVTKVGYRTGVSQQKWGTGQLTRRCPVPYFCLDLHVLYLCFVLGSPSKSFRMASGGDLKAFEIFRNPSKKLIFIAQLR